MSLGWLAVKNVRHAPVRTAILALGLSVAVAAALLFFGFTRHTYWSLAETFARSGQGHIQVAAADWFESPEPDQHRTSVEELRAFERVLNEQLGERVVASTVRRDLTGLVAFEGRSGVFLGVGTEPSAEGGLAPLAPLVAGVSLSEAPPNGVILGQPLAQRLGAHPGDWVTVLVTTDDGLTNAADFQLVGLVRTGVRTLDRTLARFPLDASLSLTAAVEADVLVVALKDTDDTDFVMEAARQLTTEHPGLAVRPWYEQAHYYIAVKALYDRIFGIFQLLMLAVAGLAMSHAVAAVVVQRRAEIALLRVIGLKRRQILWLFLSEGALLGLLGGMGGVILANLVATVTASLGGIPMPPPPGFADGYSAQFHLAAWGYLVVLPTTLIVAMAASSAPAVRASRGALSRALMTALLLLSMLPTSASAQDRLARADAANALPVDQVCTVQLLVTEGENKVAWEVNIKGTRSLARTLSLPAERAQVVLYDGDQTWFQTAAMRGPMRIGTSQRLAGRLPLADLMARPLAERWEITEERVDTVLVQARPGGTGAYASAELDFEGDQLVAARMAGPSGRVVHSATWNWREDSVQVEITGARNRGGTTVVTATKPRCEPGELAIDAADLGGLLSPG